MGEGEDTLENYIVFVVQYLVSEVNLCFSYYVNILVSYVMFCYLHVFNIQYCLL